MVTHRLEKWDDHKDRFELTTFTQSPAGFKGETAVECGRYNLFWNLPLHQRCTKWVYLPQGNPRTLQTGKAGIPTIPTQYWDRVGPCINLVHNRLLNMTFVTDIPHFLVILELTEEPMQWIYRQGGDKIALYPWIFTRISVESHHRDTKEVKLFCYKEVFT